MTFFQFLNTGEELENIQKVAEKVFCEELHDLPYILQRPDGETSKWYDWEEDLLKLSQEKEMTDIPIFLRGIGEENCDLWEARALNGTVTIKRVTVILPKWEDRELPGWNLEYVDSST